MKKSLLCLFLLLITKIFPDFLKSITCIVYNLNIYVLYLNSKSNMEQPRNERDGMFYDLLYRGEQDTDLYCC